MLVEARLEFPPTSSPTSKDIIPAVSSTSDGLRTDTADMSLARINPDLLMGESSPEPLQSSPVVNGKPPGYVSHGDRIILERYSDRGNIHDRACLDCKGR